MSMNPNHIAISDEDSEWLYTHVSKNIVYTFRKGQTLLDVAEYPEAAAALTERWAAQ